MIVSKVHNETFNFTDKQLASVCLTFNHGFGLMTEDEQKLLLRAARSWADAFRKELENPRG
jgi:hypothetical protein